MIIEGCVLNAATIEVVGTQVVNSINTLEGERIRCQHLSNYLFESGREAERILRHYQPFVVIGKAKNLLAFNMALQRL